MLILWEHNQMSLKYPAVPRPASIPRFILTHLVDATLLRPGQGSYVDGEWVDGVDVSSTIKINIQPMRGYELMSMPEADRSREWVKFYTTENIQGIQEGSLSSPTPRSPDRIVWDGRTFEVSKVSTYKMGVLDHTKVIAARVPESAGL